MAPDNIFLDPEMCLQFPGCRNSLDIPYRWLFWDKTLLGAGLDPEQVICVVI